MALVLYDRVQQTGTANTTVSFTLSGSVTGYQSFSVVGNGNTTYYGATDTSGNWEAGIGSYATGGTLTRTTILASSNSGSAVTFSGTVTVFVTYPAEKSVNLDSSGNVSALGTISSGTWQGSTVGVAYGGTGVTTSSSTSANSVVLRDANVNVTANNFLAGYNVITASGGTTVLTVASAYYQRISGSTTQTIQLPIATTMANGQGFTFDNDSSGTVTIVDSASATIDTIPSGGYGYIFVEDNTTSAGSWGKYALLPATYDFNTTTANFGNATITNATWNGGTIASGYGGTGLTTFTAANYALYSTSSSALTAGTLPVAAGGTGLTTYTAGDLPYYSSGAAFSKLPIGTNGQVLTSSGTAPQWTSASSIVGGAAGSNTQIQFNNSGALGASSGLTWDGSTLTATAINNTPIGSTTPAAGTFTTLNSTGGALNGTIGGTTPAAGTFTTITGQTEVLKGTGQNLLLQSSVLTNAAWGTSALTLTGIQADPFGGTTAALLNDGLTTNIHYVFQTLTFSAIPYTYSIYAKAGTSNYIGIVSPAIASGVIFNLSNGTFSANIVSAPTSYSITAVTGAAGWYRCSITFTPSAGSAQVYVFMSENGTTYSYTGTGLTSYIAAPQLEVGTTVNTYIPTTTTAVYGTPTLSFSGVAGLGLQSDGSLYVSPAGTGALQAQATTSSAVGGNARGANAVDWQTTRGSSDKVASGQLSAVLSGYGNKGSSYSSVAVGGVNNTSSQLYSFIGNGSSNSISSGLEYSGIVCGYNNTANGQWNFIGGGAYNSGTSGTAVTTQATTTVTSGSAAVTLSGSNASIKVGQYITGTGMAENTYVAAISGTSLTLSQNANANGTPTLYFYTPHGVVVGGGNNQATGSYSFIGGGGDAGTSANRNVASGDWSFVGGGWKNTASGIYSAVGGGAGNTASGSGSFVGGGGTNNGASGYPNTASGEGSFVGSGLSCNASGKGSSVVSGYFNNANADWSTVVGGFFGTVRAIQGNTVFAAQGAPISMSGGCVQSALLLLARQTTDATPTVLASNSSAAGTTNQVILPNNSAYYFKARVISGVTGGGNTKAWTLEGAIKRGANAASTAIVGSVTTTVVAADAGASTWTVTATADTTNGGLAITFTGQASTTIRTVCSVQTVEMTF